MNAKQIAENCTRFLTGHYRQSPYTTLSEIVNNMPQETAADIYGTGDLIEEFESQVAKILGKEAAVFMPSGTMAQPIALRIWAERKNIASFGFHPKSHLELHEHKSYQFLHKLQGVYVGAPNQLMSLIDLKNTNVPLSSLLIELPQREIGGQLPTWNELTEITTWAKQHNIALHLDGARLWECKPFYQKEYSEICSLFDSVYVSFYKGLGGITGAILAGEKDLIAQAKIWKRRQGGDLFHLYPYILSAKQSLEKRLPLMEKYHKKAIAIAQILQEIPNIKTIPLKPNTNMMHVYLRGEATTLETKSLEIAQETKIWLFNKVIKTELPDYCKFELSVGDASLDITDVEIRKVFEKLMCV